MNGRQEEKTRNEAELLREVLSGSSESYGQIFRLHREKAYGLALQYTRNKEDAMDVVQDAFVRAYVNLKKFDLSRDFGPWLLTIVRNMAIDLLRKRKRRTEDELPPVLPDRSRRGRTEETVLRLEVREVIEGLSADQRDIIFLKDYQGHSYREIAQILDIPLGTVMSRLHHARKALAAQLKKR